MAYLIGMNVQEVDGSGAPALRGAATSVGAFNIVTHRGVPNTPIRITSYPKFVERFGGYFAGGLGAYLVKGFFDNGGRTVYVNRVAAPSAAPASQLLTDDAANTLLLEAGFRGEEDPGSWADDLYVTVARSMSGETALRETDPAELTGGVLADPTDMSPLTPLELTVDGQAVTVSFVASDFPDGPANATPQQIVDAVNAHTAAVVASLAGGGEIVLTSTGAGAAQNEGRTSIEVTAAHAELGLGAGDSASGTLAALAANQAQVASVDAFAVGDAIEVSDGATTETAKIVRVADATSILEWDTALAAPGAYTAADVRIRALTFDVTLAKGGTEEDAVVETWTGLSMEPDVDNYAETVINDPIRGSTYVVATDQGSASAPGANRPQDLAYTRFSPGTDGVPTVNDFVGDQAARTGFYAFDPHDVQLVVCERSDPAIVTAALTYCANRGDCMFIGSVPEGLVEAGQAVNYGTQFQGKKVYGALYGPYIKIFDPAGSGDNPVRFVPPQGHIAGVYARIESTRGIHKAPAGDEASIRGALDVAYRLTQAEHDDLVRNGSINGVRVVAGAGVVVDASRTLSTDTRWLYVNVRLLFNYVKSTLLQGLTWVRQEPNRDTLWSLVKYGAVTPFLMGLYQQGAFGTGTPEEVFTVICDASNNPPEEVDQGNFKVEVYFYPSKPAETIIIIVGQQPSGGAVAEA